MRRTRLRYLKNPDRRRVDRYIILSHIRNFNYIPNPMTPLMRERLPYNIFHLHREYYRERLERPFLPFHYYCGENKKDWDITVASPLNYRSDIMVEMVKYGIIDPNFLDSIVIAVQDNYVMNIPDVRTYEITTNLVISPLMKMLRMKNFNSSVFWLDEIVHQEAYDRLDHTNINNRYDYEYTPMVYFDRVIFNLEARRFI